MSGRLSLGVAMPRWSFTLGLAVAAVLGAVVAPRLRPLVLPPTSPPTPPTPVATTPPPTPSATGSLDVDLAFDRIAVRPGTYERSLVLRITAPEDVGKAIDRPLDVAVVMDTSGSMAERGKIGYARRAAEHVVRGLGDGDLFSLVTFADRAAVIVPPATIADADALARRIGAIDEGGGTNLFDGLETGGRAVASSRRGHLGRVILLSDGNANAGVVDPVRMRDAVAALARDGITVSTIGLGLDYNDALLSSLADAGGGTYDFVDDPAELVAVFDDELSRSASLVAQGARVSVALPPGVVVDEVVGWDATRTATGFDLFLGDVYAGESRTVVLRAQVDGDIPRAVSAHVEWDDVVIGSMASASPTVVTRVAATDAEVAASVDVEAAVAAARVEGARLLRASTDAYARGDRRGAAELARKSQGVLAEAATAWDAPALLDDAATAGEAASGYDRWEPSAPAGQRMLRANHEYYLNGTRGSGMSGRR